jgi:release factor glutamine methyltransferase
MFTSQTMTLKEHYHLYIHQLSTVYDKDESRAITKMVFESVFGKVRPDSADHHLEEPFEAILRQYLKRLLHCEPVQYVLGYAWFCNRRYKVNRQVLIPRPETEELVDLVCKSVNPAKSFQIIDIGTGSGCIAVELSLKFLISDVYAMDVSPDALAVAQDNADAHGAKIRFIADSILAPRWTVYADCYDIIVSNPPYIAKQEAMTMHKNVLDWEPHQALFVQHDALEFYKAIADFSNKKLSPGGSVFLEINPEYARETQNLFTEKGYSSELVKDLSGKQRFLKVKRL